LLAIGGIAWVVWDGRGRDQAKRNPNYLRGILFGLGAAAGQAIGLVLSKKGLGMEMPAITGNVIRMLVATSSLWLLTLFQGQVKYTVHQIRQNPKANWFTLAGAICGPYIGVSLSLYAVQHSNVGIASTLMALPPIILLPVSYFLFKERFGWGAVFGTVIAICGVAILFII